MLRNIEFIKNGIIHFHYLIYMAIPEQKNPLTGVMKFEKVLTYAYARR